MLTAILQRLLLCFVLAKAEASSDSLDDICISALTNPLVADATTTAEQTSASVNTSAEECVNDNSLDDSKEDLKSEDEDEEEFYDDDDEYDENDDEDDLEDEEEEEEEEDYEEDFEEEEAGPWLPGNYFGVVQSLESESAEDYAKLLAKLDETYTYITDVVLAVDEFEKVQDVCYNHHEMCTQWAIEGECKNNPDYMNEECPAACLSCHLLHYEVRCMAHPLDPVSLEKPGDLNRLFERIVQDYNTHVWSRPNYATVTEEEKEAYDNNGENETAADDYLLGPWIVSIDDFLTKQETDRLMYHGALEGYERSQGVGEANEETGEMEPIVFEERTSTNAWCEDVCEEDPIVEGVLERIVNLTGIPQEYSEPLQLLKYEEGQYYETHSDYIEREWNAVQGPRIITVFMYLNDVEEGGETRFDWFDLKVKPKRGRVVIWPNVLDEDPTEGEERTEHEALPVIKGQKFGANAWLHLRNRARASEMNC